MTPLKKRADSKLSHSPVVTCSGAESLRGASLRLGRLFLAALWWRVGFERVEKTSRDGCYFIDCSQERSFIRFRRFVEAGDLSDELQRGGMNLVGVDRRIEVEQSFDVPAHAACPPQNRNQRALGKQDFPQGLKPAFVLA